MSSVNVCIQCGGAGILKRVIEHRVLEHECQACEGNGYTGQTWKGTAEPKDVKDEVQAQAILLNAVKTQLNDDSDEFSLFMQFTQVRLRQYTVKYVTCDCCTGIWPLKDLSGRVRFLYDRQAGAGETVCSCAESIGT
jgi:hypothetical protein